MKKISAQIVADSIDNRGNRITSYILTYPRFIHSELMTHRMFSRNAASSRAIPFAKMVKDIEEDPFIPIAWQKDHKGMQGTEYLDCKQDIDWNISKWLRARDWAIQSAKVLNNGEVTKQLCNRLLEPFQWYTCLVTATEFDNFFELRCPEYQTPVSKTIEPQYSWEDLMDNHSNPDNLDKLETNKDNWIFKMQHSLSSAEIHIQALAEAMWDAWNESTPKELKASEWHIPFGDKMNSENIAKAIGFKTSDYDWHNKELWSKIQVATARCARLSYMTFDGEIDYEKDIKLHDQLLESRHMSPFEHCARVANDEEYMYNCRKVQHVGCETEHYDNGISEDVYIANKDMGWFNNFRGFIPYRYIIENE